MTNSLPFQNDRERVQSKLTKAVGEGQLDLGEFTELMDVVWSTDDHSALVRIEQQAMGIPAADVNGTPAASPFAGNRATAPMATTVSTIMGEQRREGYWLVGDQLETRSWLGTVYLDFRRASTTSPQVTIITNCVMGDLKIIVPPGVQVISEVSTIMGDVKMESSAPAPGAPQLILRGNCIMGTVAVKVLPMEAEPSLWWRFFA